jgi:uncharacterized membrane protein YgdD (TMEM256/DUF423 family)
MRPGIFLFCGTVFGLLGVILGAFGAHDLRERLGPEMLAVWHTAVEYQFYHALALLVVGVLGVLWPHNVQLVWAGWVFVAGVILFSGSLYVLALSGVRWIGAITPIGGLALIAGWLLLLLAVYRYSF